MQRLATSQSGNALMLVLIGVVLFSALAFSFMRSGRQGVSNLSSQEADMYAQEILAHFNQVESAFNRLRMKKCSEFDISFRNSGDTNGYETSNDSPTAPPDRSCHIFDANGGKMTFTMDWKKYQIRADVMSDPAQSGNAIYTFNNGSNVGVGTAANDMMVHLNFVRPDICRAYNRILKLEIDTSIADVGPIAGDENTAYANRTTFCRYNNATATHGQIRYVYLAR